MSIKSIRIKNLLSFEDVYISDFKDINCIVGQNNAGKSNLLALLNYFYSSLREERVVPPLLNSNYSAMGSITIEYDTTRLKKVVTSKGVKNPYFRHIFNTLFALKNNLTGLAAFSEFINEQNRKKSKYFLTLTVKKDNSISWSTKNRDALEIINRVYPFFSIDTRHINLYDWSKIWETISQLKFLNMNSLKTQDLIGYIDGNVSKKSGAYKDYVEKVNEIASTSAYSYQEKVLNYVKVGLKGHTFNIEGEELLRQSDGTNSHKFLELFLSLMIALTRREFITPTVFVDEPEVGLHPKRNEQLIFRLHSLYKSYQKTKEEREVGRYATPYPKIIFSTHSPNIIKTVVKLFKGKDEHQVLHFKKSKNKPTSVRTIKSHYEDPRFLNIFSDNEARLFFSKFILFVEGETELEIFGNLNLVSKFDKLRDIDVYAANDVHLNAISPSKSNLPIPFLILYDSDHLLKCNIVNTGKKALGNLSFNNRKVNLKKIEKRYKCTFYGSKEYSVRKAIEELRKSIDSPKKLNQNLTDFSVFKLSSFISYANRKVFHSQNIRFNETTIEGSLINENSFQYLIGWLLDEFRYNFNVTPVSNTTAKVRGIKRSYIRHQDVKKAFHAIFSSCEKAESIPKSLVNFTDRIKIKYLRLIRDEVKGSGLSERELVIAMKLVFGGKSNTYQKYGTDSYRDFISPQMKGLVEKIKTEYLVHFTFDTTKTSGWATSFLDFSISKLELEVSGDDKRFYARFSVVFPELNDIIKKVSF
ncbi:retron Eco8 family effector endonuclease [Aliiglaciecola sp. NS0011-25]|uniref:retron Eco8 family effector endonuclease n=1 Tax=Aliiglaciecola sp. NS0011-25 TaxID=3127654 RepID=UPI00310C8016